MSTASDQLDAAIAKLYSTFKDYRIETLRGCPHCTSDQQSDYLASQPLRSLTPDDLERYSFKAMSTRGSVEDFKHFLPRIFEIAALEPTAGWIVEVVFDKLEYGKWDRWSHAEQSAVRDYLHALWLELLTSYTHTKSADTYLCGIGNAETDLSEYLRVWEANHSLSAARHLSDFIECNLPWGNKKLPRESLGNAFWADHQASDKQVFDWLMEPQRLEYLECAFWLAAESGNREAEGEISRAVEILKLRQRIHREQVVGTEANGDVRW